MGRKPPHCLSYINRIIIHFVVFLFSEEKKDEVQRNLTPLEELPHEPKIQNVLIKLMGDIRRMGAPADHDRKRQDMVRDEQGKRSQRRERRKATHLEEQRRLKQQQQQEKQLKSEIPLDGVTDILPDEDDTQQLNQEVFIPVGGNDVEEEDDGTGLSSGTRLAMTFNSFHVLVTVLRPALDHHQNTDTALKMKKGPSLHKKGKNHRHYLFFDNVYNCISEGEWAELNKEFRLLLEQIEYGLARKLSKKDGGGNYELSCGDYISSLFNRSEFTSEEVLMKHCMSLDGTSNSVENQLHHALMNRFSYTNSNRQWALKKSIDTLQIKLSNAISRRFRGARLTVYGSCLSGLALEGSHDVDVSVFIPELDELKQRFDKEAITGDEYGKKMKKIVFQVRNALRNDSSFVELWAIAHCRVPVVKGIDCRAQNPYSFDGSLHFDLCFLNDIAVVNSSLLREYSLLDNRVRVMMLSVKSFSKQNNIASAADGTMSSYTWLNLVVFYLQCIGFLPSLQCSKLMDSHGFSPDVKGNRWHSINGLQTYYLTSEQITRRKIWKQPSHFSDTTLPSLLFGFFNFYSNVFPQQAVAASIRLGKCSLPKTSFLRTGRLWRLCIEDPFEVSEFIRYEIIGHSLPMVIAHGFSSSLNRFLTRIALTILVVT